MMKKTHLFMFILILFFCVQICIGTVLPIPTLSTMLHNVSTIAKGTFITGGEEVMFAMETALKGEYIPTLSVRYRHSGLDHVLPSLAEEAAKLNGQECYILGNLQDGVVILPWRNFSIWPQGMLRPEPMFKDVNTCESFIKHLLEYEQLEFDLNALANRLLNDLQIDELRLGVLLYLSVSPNPFQENQLLRQDLSSIIAAYIASNSLYEEWIADAMQNIYAHMPLSIVLPYFFEVAKQGGEQGKLALSAVNVNLVYRGVIEHKTDNIDKLSDALVSALPRFRSLDVPKASRLFESANTNLADSASLVFSEILGEPMPQTKIRMEEKAYWVERVAELEASLRK